jgi:DNA-binding IclR family transcriptional regulator
LSFPAVFCTVFWSKRINMRKSGVAFDREEHAPDICAAGVVLRDLVGNDLAISVPAQRPRAREKPTAERLRASSASTRARRRPRARASAAGRSKVSAVEGGAA